ncbi:MAG: P-II family nitrogen regulator [Spirochaetales bacterium]|nr:P-II family nitrogen regulator [Spirochaetales bacterium]
MFLVTAMIQPNKFEDVKKALFEAEITKMTVSSVKGCGQQMGYEETFRGVAQEINLLTKIRLDIAVTEPYVDKTIDAIVKAAHTDTIGDGKIFVTELKECVRIRTGERGEKAVG